MAAIKSFPTISLNITLGLTEDEARALYALTEYGIDNFIVFFYSHLGRSALEDYEAGLRSLLLTAKEQLPRYFRDTDAARDVFIHGEKK